VKSDSGFDLFLGFARSRGLQLDPVSVEMLKEYVSSLLSWNTRINLISRTTDASDVWVAHILHSISPLFFVDIPADSRLLDIGSGGGLPGIPLAIVRRDMDVTLMDSIRKKTAALENMVHELGLPNVTVVTGRAEDQESSPILSSQFDVITARAVAPLPDLIRWSLPFARHPGVSDGPGSKYQTPFLIALKGGSLEEEIEVARVKWKGAAISIEEMYLEGLEEKRLVVVEFFRHM